MHEESPFQKIPYQHSHLIHNTVAAEIVVPIILEHISCTSVLDVGCGLGCWLKVFKDHGINDIMGIDGDYVDRAKLMISRDHFLAGNLNDPFQLQRRFGLVLCLEVAEHLLTSSSETLIGNLCDHSDNIVFSSAIPGQGGQNHINEQWPEYWEEIFNKLGYKKLDLIRPLVWSNKKVDLWYRQNIYFFTKNVTLIRRPLRQHVIAPIHPDLWTKKIALLETLTEEVNNFEKGGAGIMRSFKALINAIKNKF